MFLTGFDSKVLNTL
ncbi:hypothetical protein ACVQ90_01615 [Staphylococcus aureus]